MTHEASSCVELRTAGRDANMFPSSSSTHAGTGDHATVYSTILSKAMQSDRVPAEPPTHLLDPATTFILDGGEC